MTPAPRAPWTFSANDRLRPLPPLPAPTVCRLAPANFAAASNVPTLPRNNLPVIPPSPKARCPTAGLPDSSVALELRCQEFSARDGQSRAPARTPAQTAPALQIVVSIRRKIRGQYKL